MRTMTKLMLTAVLIFSSACGADNGYRSIPIEELPQNAQTFIDITFPDIKISQILQNTELFEDDFKVFFENGTKIEFKSNGNWSDIECTTTKIPLSAMPARINKYLSEKHPQTDVIKIDRNTKEYELELRNGLELKFNNNGEFKHYED